MEADPEVERFIGVKWDTAVLACRKAMDSIRAVVPEVAHPLPEASRRRLERALTALSTAHRELHDAGPDVLGEAEYEIYLAETVEWRMEREKRREES